MPAASGRARASMRSSATGCPLSGGLTGTPYVGLGFGEARDYRLGWRLASGRWQSFSLGVEAARREAASDDAPEHRLGLEAGLRW